MLYFVKKTRIDASAKVLFSWHNRLSVFRRLSFPLEKYHPSVGSSDVGRLILENRHGLFTRRLVGIQSDFSGGKLLCDETVQAPLPKWTHTHQFLPETDNTCLITDRVEYEPPLGPLGVLAMGGIVGKKLDRLFNFRHQRTQNDLSRYFPFSDRGLLKIAISGASGLIGSELDLFLNCAGHLVRHLVRRMPKPESSEIFWDPYSRQLAPNEMEGHDAVIHLAGENIGAGKWTKNKKDEIRNSRVKGTRFLAEVLAGLRNPPKVLIVASAIGYYGNREDEELTEESPAGRGFLPEVCQEWEDAAEPARKAGIAVAHLRTGIVLSPLGGALPKMLAPLRRGLGGAIGKGNQWMSWISMEDLIGVIHHLIYSENLSGPVNATAPNPVRNGDFVKILGKVMSRPSLLSMPGSVVKALFGEMGETLLLESQKVMPSRLTQDGFTFLYPDLEQALRWELGRL